MPVQRPVIIDPALTELYDALMQRIEPELTSAMLPRLQDIYPQGSETEEQAAAREERYRKAFALCDERMKAVMNEWKQEIQAEKRRMLSGHLTASVSEDEKRMTHLDDAIGNA